jgi:hypothetical protein
VALATRSERYAFAGGYPTAETVRRAYDDADLNRAVQAYRFFYPTISGLAIFKGSEAAGVVANRAFGVLDTRPERGIARGTPLTPDERMTRILEEAARIGKGQMLLQACADRRPDRVVWPGTQWEGAALRFENGDFEADGYLDVDAGEKWLYQAIAASPAMFRRSTGAGSLYWLGLRDSRGQYPDGGQAYTLSVPQPVPGKLFWSITVYGAETRSQIQTSQDRAGLRSLFELNDVATHSPVQLHLGPDTPSDTPAATRWITTIPGEGWFAYFRMDSNNPRSTAPGNYPTSSQCSTASCDRPKVEGRNVDADAATN